MGFTNTKLSKQILHHALIKYTDKPDVYSFDIRHAYIQLLLTAVNSDTEPYEPYAVIGHKNKQLLCLIYSKRYLISILQFIRILLHYTARTLLCGNSAAHCGDCYVKTSERDCLHFYVC